MRRFLTALRDQLKQEPVSGTEKPAASAMILAFDHLGRCNSGEAIHLDSCPQFETIVVKTRFSVYELIVLQGSVGDVLVRGGGKFPKLCRVRFAGSTVGGSGLKVNAIDVGLRMEFQVGERIIVTSVVKAVSRHNALPNVTVCEMAH